MADWRYLAYRLNGDGTGTLIDPDLPLQGASLTTVLSGPDALTARIEPSIARLISDVDGLPVITPHSTAIFAEEDGSICHGTIVTQAPWTGESLSITGVGFSGFPKGKPYQGDKFFVQTDPLDIVRHIWTYLQGRPRGNIGMTLGATKVGRLIGTVLQQVEFDTQAGPVSFEAGPYKLNWWETDDLGGKIDDLATNEKFDYVERHEWNAARDAVLHYLDFGVPRIGRRRNDLRFVEGENMIVKTAIDRSDEDYADEVIVRGAGEGRTQIRGYDARPSEKRLSKPYVFEDKGIKSVKDANAKAKAILSTLTGAPDITEIAVIDRAGHTQLGAWSNGDEIQITTLGEWGETSGFYRVLSTTITPEDISVARLAVMRADKIPS
jgi:hypothetical protein